MALGQVERDILNWLAKPARRVEWHDTRAITQGVERIEWASQAQISRYRQALARLERLGLLDRFGSITEWRLKSAEGASGSLPRAMKAVMAMVADEPQESKHGEEC